MITLQRRGLLLRVYGAVWMYIRGVDVATRFHLPQKTWSLLHSDLLLVMRHPVILLFFMLVELDQWYQYNTYSTLFQQWPWSMDQSYSLTFDSFKYFETLRHWSTTPPLQSYFHSVSFIAILPFSFTSAMDQLLAQRTLSLLHHLMRLVLQLHGSILANIEGLEIQFGNRGTTLPAHHPYSSSMAPMDTPILLPGLSTTPTHSSHPSATASFPLYSPSLHRQHHHTTKRTLSPQSHPPATKHHRINSRAGTPAPPAAPKTAGPTPAARRSKAPRARSHSPNSDDSTSHHSVTAAPSRPSPHFSDPRAISNPATESTPIPAPEPSPPESPIGTIPAPWSSQEDETLISLKSDSKARPSWASIGARMRRTPSECKARWQLLRLQQAAPSETTPPPPTPPPSTNPGPPRPPTPHP